MMKCSTMLASVGAATCSTKLHPQELLAMMKDFGTMS
jgi:hypothetical protein